MHSAQYFMWKPKMGENHWMFFLYYAKITFIYQHQLDGSTDPLIYRHQPKRSSNSLFLSPWYHLGKINEYILSRSVSFTYLHRHDSLDHHLWYGFMLSLQHCSYLASLLLLRYNTFGREVKTPRTETLRAKTPRVETPRAKTLRDDQKY